MKSDGKREYLARVSPSTPSADEGSRLRKDAEPSASVDLSRAKEQLDLDAKTVPGARQENVEVQLQAEAANVQSQTVLNKTLSFWSYPALGVQFGFDSQQRNCLSVGLSAPM